MWVLSLVLASVATIAASASADYVEGKAFNRFITIWLENTDYDKAAGDRESSVFSIIRMVACTDFCSKPCLARKER
jgi:hypothetical protein